MHVNILLLAVLFQNLLLYRGAGIEAGNSRRKGALDVATASRAARVLSVDEMSTYFLLKQLDRMYRACEMMQVSKILFATLTTAR